MKQENECYSKDWELIPFNSNIEMLSGFPFDSNNFNDNKGTPLIRIRNIISGSTETFYDGDYSTDFLINKGDILVGMDGDFHIRRWKGTPSLLNQRILKLYEGTSSDINLEFFYYLAQPFLLNVHKRTAGTTVKHLSTKDFRNASFKIPKYPEQQKIAEILSTVDDKIEVIDQQIIETQELKKGLMQRLLTKGIGHSKFKDSPLGMIPESWDVVKFGDLISSHSYGPRFSSKDYSETGNVKTIRGTDINKTGDILYKQVPTAMLPNDFVENHKLKDGDLVMITTADCGLTGVYFDQGFPFIPSAYAVRIRLNEKAYPTYFKYIFQTDLAKNQVDKFIRKGTVANLPGSDILKFTFPKPAFDEQKKVADILSTVDDKLNVLSEKKNNYQALKQGLMQQLLTGKKRVNVSTY